jgi:hypothetical protein
MRTAKGGYIVTKPTAAELSAVKPYLVDKIVRWSQEEGHCVVVEEALTAVFGSPPANGWRDSDGRDYDGFDIDGNEADDAAEDSDGKSNGKHVGHDEAVRTPCALLWAR